jgi:outer membrane protein
MKSIKFLFFWSIFFAFSNIRAQETELLDLKKCVEFAIQNNLQVKQAELNIRQSELSEKQAKWAISPTANASLRHGGNFGRSIDFTSYQYVTQATHSSQFSINIGQPVYNGMQIKNRVRQSVIDVQAGEKDAAQIKDNIGLAVAQAYLTILLADEQIAVLKEQVKMSQAQLDQTNKLIKAGNLPENNRFDLEAQIARNEQSVVAAENGLEMAYMNLKVLMNMEPSKEIRISKIDVQAPDNIQSSTMDEVFAQAGSRMPNILAARLREQSAEMGIRIAKGALQPSISAYGSVFTNFSSAAKNRSFEQQTQTINLDVLGISVPVGFPITVPVEGGTIPYFKQIGDNIYSNVGVNVNVPIFNGFQTRIAIERADLAVKIAKMNTLTVQNQLKTDIQRSINDLKAAEKSYAVAEKSLKATKASAENTKKRFELGVVNAFEMVSVQNMLISAESSLLQAKYDYVFKLKVLDYYKGITITDNQQ